MSGCLGIHRGVSLPIVHQLHCQSRTIHSARPLHQTPIPICGDMYRPCSHCQSTARQTRQGTHHHIFRLTSSVLMASTHYYIYRRLRTELRSPAIQPLSHHNAVAHHVPFALCGVLHRVHHHPHCRQQTYKHLQAAYRQLLLGHQPEP